MVTDSYNSVIYYIIGLVIHLQGHRKELFEGVVLNRI